MPNPDDLFELHVQERGRWSLLERFKSFEKEEAIAEAKRHFTLPNIEAVRVIREVYDEGEQVYKERTIYRNAKTKTDAATKSPQLKKFTPTVVPPKPAAKAPEPAPAKPPEVERAPPPPPRRRSNTLTKRVVLATTAGATLTGGASAFIYTNADKLAGIALTDTVLYSSTVGLFIAAFFLSLYLFGRSKGDGAPVPDVVAEELAKVQAAISEPATNWADRKIDVNAGTLDGATVAPTAAAPPPPQPVVAEAPPEPAKPESKPETAPDLAASIAATAEPEVDQTHRAEVLKFFQDCLTHEAAQPLIGGGQMDRDTTFACHLFLLGAGEAYLKATQGQGDMLAPVLQTALEVLGSDATRARAFVNSRADYIKDPRYRAMVKAGRSAMASFINRTGGAGQALAEAMKAWKTHIVEPESDIIAVMFTDMVSSVQTTQTLGDEGAMMVVQAHNLIVGVCLKKHRGHQVKHTGDGVMAIFPRVADGLACANEIQRQILEHNSNSMGQGHRLRVRIGLSAGRPIKDQDDYFGMVVQLSARVCAIANEGEICVHSTVMEHAAKDTSFAFSPPQRVALKGFAEQQGIAFSLWNDGQQGLIPEAGGVGAAISAMSSQAAAG